MTTRFSKPDLQVLERVCKNRGQDVGGFVRLATLKELAALGVFDEGCTVDVTVTCVLLSRKFVKGGQQIEPFSGLRNLDAPVEVADRFVRLSRPGRIHRI